MRGRLLVLVLAACGHEEPDVPPIDAVADSSIDAPPPGPTKVIGCPGTTSPSEALPQECVRPAGVTWLADEGSLMSATAPLPAGTFHQGLTGCVWFVARTSGDHVELEVAAYGCRFHATVPSAWTCDACGCHTVATEASGSIGFEGCDPTSRGVNYSGGMGYTLDDTAGTLTTAGFFADTGSSPSSCGCP